MKFDPPNAVSVMNQAVASVGDDGDSWEVIGEPLDEPVDGVLPAYDKNLDLKLKPSPPDKRLEICGLVWGRIEKDAARLNGLAAAIDNVSSVVKSGKERLAHDWKGEAFDTFRLAIEKIETTLNDYSAAVKVAAADVKSAMDSIRTLYGTYQNETLTNHLEFGENLAKPADWWRMSSNDAEFVTNYCTDHADNLANCCYNDDEQVGIIDRQFVNRRLFDVLVSWDCTDNAGVVIAQYNTTVGDAKEERSHISGKINNWYEATDQLKKDVDDLLGAGLDNLRKIAETKIFASMSVPGAGAAGGGPGPGGGDPGQGGPGGGDPGPGGGYPGGGSGGGDAAMPQPGPQPAQVDPTAAPEPTDPAQAGPPAEPPAASDGAVTIKDGDRSISVTSPDGDGHVKVTVEGADGKAKSYDLDFDAASGMEPRTGAEGDKAADRGTERVPAGTNGQCIIKDGPLTITAERPLFDPGTIKLEVDDGVNDPTVYSLDFDEKPGDADQPADAQAGPAKDGTQADGKADPAGDGAQADGGSDTAKAGPANADGSVADTKDGGSPEEANDGKAESAADNGKPAEKEQLTTPQAVLPGDPGSEPGPIVPDQSTGEAGLASAGEGEPADSAGNSAAGAMPMMAGAGAGAGGEAGRAGTGWSVHGDLFDNHDPVYSMHGVLGEDDLEGR